MYFALVDKQIYFKKINKKSLYFKRTKKEYQSKFTYISCPILYQIKILDKDNNTFQEYIFYIFVKLTTEVFFYEECFRVNQFLRNVLLTTKISFPVLLSDQTSYVYLKVCSYISQQIYCFLFTFCRYMF